MHFSNLVVYIFLKNMIYRITLSSAFFTAHFYSYLVCETSYPYIVIRIYGVEVDAKGHTLGRRCRIYR